MANTHDDIIKIVIIGDSGVGKSSIISRYFNGIFSDAITPTTGVNLCVKTSLLEDIRTVFQIWDTSGNELYRSMISAYYRSPKFIIFVFDHNDYSSFLNLKEWVHKVAEKHHLGDDTVVIIVGNKNDLIHNVPIDEVEFLAHSLNTYWNTVNISSVSSKTGDGILELFSYILHNHTPTKNIVKINPWYTMKYIPCC